MKTLDKYVRTTNLRQAPTDRVALGVVWPAAPSVIQPDLVSQKVHVVVEVDPIVLEVYRIVLRVTVHRVVPNDSKWMNGFRKWPRGQVCAG